MTKNKKSRLFSQTGFILQVNSEAGLSNLYKVNRY